MAGNRAVAQIVAREPTRRRATARQTGLRSDEAIRRYARKAVSFFRRNPDLPLKYFAIYLGAAVNGELEAVGSKAVEVKIDDGALAPRSSTPRAGGCTSPGEFTHREEVA